MRPESSRDAADGPKRGRIVLAGTPLGRPGDASEHLRQLLGEADIVAAEDTRRTLRLAADLGVRAADIANSLRTLVAGQTVGNWRAPDGENYDVNVRISPDSRDSIADLQRIPINVATAADGSARVVRLSQVADVVPASGPNQINRRDLNREINIDANALGRSAGEIAQVHGSLGDLGPVGEERGLAGVDEVLGTTTVLAAAPPTGLLGTGGPGAIAGLTLPGKRPLFTGTDPGAVSQAPLDGPIAALVSGRGALAPGLVASQLWSAVTGDTRTPPIPPWWRARCRRSSSASRPAPAGFA